MVFCETIPVIYILSWSRYCTPFWSCKMLYKKISSCYHA